jgi:lipopolysaccharide/colanic/teichoic acid biosynthesis glycosyltransferase
MNIADLKRGNKPPDAVAMTSHQPSPQNSISDEAQRPGSRAAERALEAHKFAVLRTAGKRISLLSKVHFVKQLRLEKRRAERSKSPLSIALFRFELQDDGEGLRNSKEFLNVVQSKIRETDVIGYLGNGIIGVLLPDTGENGVEDFIRKMLDGFDERSFGTITGTYPDQLFENFLKQDPDLPEFFPFFYDLEEEDRSGPRWKRVLDLAGAGFGLALLSPLMAVTALAIKITSRGPVLYRQVRLGKHGAPFVLYKFRSMYCDTDENIHREYVTKLIHGKLEEVNQGDKDNPLYKMKSDPRVTPIGAIIRKSSIDELPQFFNVLRGEMSLVGPRPPLSYEASEYQVWHLRRILEMRPGITGLWQVGGRSETTFDDMVRLDIRYIRHCSLFLDLKILLKTIAVVVGSRGAS